MFKNIFTSRSQDNFDPRGFNTALLSHVNLKLPQLRCITRWLSDEHRHPRSWTLCCKKLVIASYKLLKQLPHLYANYSVNTTSRHANIREHI